MSDLTLLPLRPNPVVFAIFRALIGGGNIRADEYVKKTIAPGRSTLLFLLVLLFVFPSSAAEENLSVLGDEGGKILEQYLKKEADQAFDRREAAYEKIKTISDCKKWQKDRRDFFLNQIGGLPERTPLNAQTVGELKGDGYRIEKVIFHSRPDHRVTANLYLPETEGPYPGVLVPCGHSHTGKASGHYQRISILLAKNGIAALCYDPIGQGERYQILDFEKDHDQFETVPYPLKPPHPRVRFVCTIEHTTMGLGSILLGENIAQFRIWDGMRAIDYLQSRPDIIADKIGCTGISGGGTMTSYLMALDDRIVAAAPGCFPMTLRRLIETKGPQDGEQNIFGQIAFGMDESDYLNMRAPKPTLILGATRDATFAIDGTWPLFRESKRFFTRMRHPERVDMIEADVPHGFYLPLREASVQWMRRWLLGKDDIVREIENLPEPLSDEMLRSFNEGDWTDEELRCTKEGLVLLKDGEQSVFQINSETEKRLLKKRETTWPGLNLEAKQDLIRKTLGFKAVNRTQFRLAGTIQRDGYTIEKTIITPEKGIHLPALHFVPDKPSGEAILYLHGESMKADAEPGGAIEKLVREGQIVLAAELRGIGETETGHDKRDYGRGRFGRDVQETFLAYLLGRSYVGMRTGDVFAWAEYLAASKAPGKTHLIGIGEAAIPALHAAALDPDRWSSVNLKQMIPSWTEIVSGPESLNQVVSIAHGALQHYDLPDLIKMIDPEKVTVSDSVDVLGNPK